MLVHMSLQNTYHNAKANTNRADGYFLSACLVEQELLLWKMNLTRDMLWDGLLLAGLLLESASQGVIFHCVEEWIDFPANQSEQLKNSIWVSYLAET